MPKLISLYISQVAIGFAISAALVATLLTLNVANLWHLVTHTDAGLLAVFLLWLFNGIVFAGVQFGIKVMSLAENDDTSGGLMTRDLVAIPVKSEPQKRYKARNL